MASIQSPPSSHPGGSAEGNPLCLDHVPGPGETAGLASRARRSWGLDPSHQLDLGRVCDRLGIEVCVTSMGVPDGGAQGFLVPRQEGGFRIEVDPEPAGGWKSVAPGLRRSLERHRRRFLVAHELAHTLFFEGGPQGPRRVVLDCARQEEFCDEFARALLVPEEIAAQVPFAPESVVELQRRFDVSIELALRGLAAAHDGVGWLLVRREDRTLIQWDSAGPNRTARSLEALRKLAKRASQTAGAVTMPLGRGGYGRALHLAGREQAIVTWQRSVG